MIKADLARIIARDHNLAEREASAIIDSALNAIHHAVASGDTVKLAGHGTYKPASRAARTARNPMNGTTIQVPAKVVPVFTAGTAFKDHVANEQHQW